jgi:plastocyanin
VKRNILLILSCLFILTGMLAAVSCGTAYPATTTSSSTPGQTNAVTIENTAYSPADITVPAGTTVTWTNKDPIAHTVTSDTGLFDSGEMSQGSTFSHTFNDKGTFAYHCNIHATMHGTVTVQ